MRWLLVMSLLATTAQAQAPDISLRPVKRPTQAAKDTVAETIAAQQITAQSGVRTSLRPKKRPRRRAFQTVRTNTQPTAQQATALDTNRTQPQAKPKKKGLRGLFQSITPNARPSKPQRTAAICGDPDLQGTPAGRIPGKLPGCGLDNAIRLLAVGDITLSQPSIMDCSTARSVKSWVNNSVAPSVGNTGGGLKGLRVVAHYACRTRNNRKGAKISEHGKGKAIDIAGIQLRDGSEISVLKDWGRGKKGRILRQVHKQACGPFGTVLGPNADRYHKDHFHFDTAKHRGGPYCR